MLCASCNLDFNESKGTLRFERDDEYTHEYIEYKCSHCEHMNSEYNGQEKRQDWFFTFGNDKINKYHVINGSYNEARYEMFNRFGEDWAFQYDSAKAAGVDEFGLKRIN